jgi:hypothetical protein
VDGFIACVLSIFDIARLAFDQKISDNKNVVEQADHLRILFIQAMNLLNTDEMKPLVSGQWKGEDFLLHQQPFEDKLKVVFANVPSQSTVPSQSKEQKAKKNGKTTCKSDLN